MTGISKKILHKKYSSLYESDLLLFYMIVFDAKCIEDGCVALHEGKDHVQGAAVIGKAFVLLTWAGRRSRMAVPVPQRPPSVRPHLLHSGKLAPGIQ